MRALPPLVAIVAALAACGPGTLQPDAGDDATDGGDDDSGLVVTWTAQGLDDRGEVTVDRVRLNLRDLRVVGDAAPGNETYVERQELDLEGNATRQTRFDAAPPGMYSALEFALDGGADTDHGWEMTGSVVLDAKEHEWKIEDSDTLGIDLPLVGLDLGAGETRTITVVLDVLAVIEGIDWTAVEEEEEGELAIEDDSPLLPAIRARMADAFSVASID